METLLGAFGGDYGVPQCRRGNTKAAIPIADIGMHRITKVPMDLWAYR